MHNAVKQRRTSFRSGVAAALQSWKYALPDKLLERYKWFKAEPSELGKKSGTLANPLYKPSALYKKVPTAEVSLHLFDMYFEVGEKLSVDTLFRHTLHAKHEQTEKERNEVFFSASRGKE